MQAVILAGGKGTRMKELTADIPKPLLTLAGKSLLEWKIDALPANIDEVIIVVSHHKDKIMAALPGMYTAPSGKKKITFVDQGNPQGTAHALWAARNFIKGPFISMMGDDIYSKGDIERVANEPGWALTVVSTPSFPTVIEIIPDEKGFLKDVILDEEGIRGTILLDICLYKLGPDIFNASLQKLHTKNEFGLPQTVLPYILDRHIQAKVFEARSWHKINSPEDISAAEHDIDKTI